MTRTQQRAVALSAARYQLRQLKVNLLEASAADAYAALGDGSLVYCAFGIKILGEGERFHS